MSWSVLRARRVRPALGDAAAERHRRPGSRLRRRDGWYAYLFLSPALFLFLVFIAGPLAGAIALSFLRWDLLTPARFAGLHNFATLASDAVARIAVLNTFVFTFWSIALHVTVGLALALAVHRAMPAPLRYFLRTAYFFPFMVSWAAVALLWKYLLDPDFGLVNYYLRVLGISAPSVLVSPHLALPALILVDLWRTIGFTFIILLAGLQGVPAYLHEVAMIDGAGHLRRFWHVTLPMLSPALFFVCVMNFIGAFQIFDPMFIMTDGGPGNATRSIVLDIYETAFRSFQMGYGAALSLVVFLVIMAVTLVQLRLSRYWVHYQ